MTSVVPKAEIKRFEFIKQPIIEVDAKTVLDEAWFIKVVGKANVEHLKWVIGNYWEQKITRLDTDKLFTEMRILFRSKRRAKRVMNETRDEIAVRSLEWDWNRIWHTFTKKLERAVWRNLKTRDVLSQTVQLTLADLVIEENSTCQVEFKGQGYTVEVEGRRSIVGQFVATKRTKGRAVRIMNIRNRFVGRTFWQCQGRCHVEDNSPTLFDRDEGEPGQ